MATSPDDQPTAASPGATPAAPDVVSQYIGKARDFAKARPAAAAALVGVLGLALVNTLRGGGRHEKAAPAAVGAAPLPGPPDRQT